MDREKGAKSKLFYFNLFTKRGGYPQWWCFEFGWFVHKWLVFGGKQVINTPRLLV